MKYLILNADDFGYSAQVNAAVWKAHCEGVLTSASLMVAEAGWQEAVEMARRAPTLGVGLHVVTTLDRSILPPEEIPHLVGANGKFGADPLRVVLRYTYSRAAQTELKREMTAQFDRFAQTGLPWSHVDGHQHFHLCPVIWNLLLELCDRYGAHRLRVPLEEHSSLGRTERDRSKRNTAVDRILRLLCRRSLRSLRERQTLGGKPIFVCERVYGTWQTGNMNTDYLLYLLDRLQGVTNEIYFHPGTAHARPLPADQQTETQRDVELSALLAPTVRDRIQSLAVRTGRYADIEAAVLALRAAVPIA